MSKPRPFFPIEGFHPSPWRHADTSLARYALVVGLTMLIILAAGVLAAKPGYAQDQLQTPTHPPVPNPKSQIPNPQMLPVVSGLLMVLVVGFVLLVLAVFLLLRARHRWWRPSPVPPPIAAIPFLESSDGHLYFRLNRLKENGLVIGRGGREVDLKIDESTPHADTVSERHARIYYDPTCGYVIIEDLGSTNGVFINGRRAPRKNLLKDGWIVSLGQVTLTYRDGESDTGPLE